MNKTIIPVSAYVHLPWCVRKCPYCDFNSHELKTKYLLEDDYISALKADIGHEKARADIRNIETVFFGGGTPSLFSAAGFEKVLKALSKDIGLAGEVEITIEANPGTVEAGRFSDYRKIGINRLSIGVQSFSNESLQTLGRIHDSNEATSAIEIAQRCGFDNINIDLMHGLPGQNVAAAMDDLRRAVSLGPQHLSWYQLTLEPNTVFYSRPPLLPSHELCWEIQQSGREFLESEGYQQYEISAWARDEKTCKHNMNYWQFADYYGVGAGAHGKLSDPASGKVTRYQRHRIPDTYTSKSLDGSAISNEKLLSEEDLVLEFMMNALRLRSGFSSHLFIERTGLEIASIKPLLEQAKHRGLLEWENDTIKASQTGLDFLNDLLAIFLPAESKNE